MAQFKDANDRTWTITVNVGTGKKVRDVLGVDLFNLYDGGAKDVFSDVILLVNVLYVLCEEQATKSGITDVQFGEAMFGDAIESSATALMDAVADFFPQRKRQLLNRIKTDGEKLAAKMMDQAEAKLDQVVAELMSGKSSINSQA